MPPTTPLGKVNVLSAIAFSWLTSLLWQGFKKPLERDDLFLLQDSLLVDSLYTRFDKSWQAKTGHKHRLLAAMYSGFGRSWTAAGLLKFAGDTAGFCSPIVLSFLLRDLSSNANGIVYRYMMCLAIFLLQMVNTLTVNYYFHVTMMTGFKLRSVLTAAIYRKCLRISGLSRQRFSTGQIVNMSSGDVNRVDLAAGFMHYLWSGVYQIIAIVAILIFYLGPSALAGFGVFVLLMPIQSIITRQLTKFRRAVNVITDQRVKMIQEMLSGIRVIKLYAWENSFISNILGLRSDELRKIRQLQYLKSGMNAITIFVPLCATILTFLVYSWAGNALTPDVVFPAMTLFSLLRLPLILLPMVIGFYVDAKVAVERIQGFLQSEELDFYPVVGAIDGEHSVKLESCNFIWQSEVVPPKSEPAGPVAASSVSKNAAAVVVPPAVPAEGAGREKSSPAANEEVHLLSDVVSSPTAGGVSDVNFSIKKGELVAVIGSVGSGKSSLLASMVGEMKHVSGSVHFDGSVGYCPQQAWILNATLKENVLFGLPMDEAKYDDAIDVCSLRHDLDVLPAGDSTEIGEKGINLSGGQKQRVGLARLVYFDPDIVLLDDPLSAVDAHVGQRLFEDCICGKLKNKTRIIALNQLYFLRRFDYVILVDHGKIAEQGPVKKLMADANSLVRRLAEAHVGLKEDDAKDSLLEEKKADIIDQNAVAVPKKPKESKLMSVEERAIGAVSVRVYWEYFVACGGVVFLILVVFFVVVSQGSRVANDLWLSYWLEDTFGLSKESYMAIYAGLGLFQGIVGFLCSLVFLIGGLIASRTLFERILRRVAVANSKFFDTTPMGRILNRLGKDFDQVDVYLSDSLRMFFLTFGQSFSTFVLISVLIPIFLAALVPLLLFYYFVQIFYRASSRELKRLDLISKSPLVSSFSETLTGLATIRAFKEEHRFVDRNAHLINENNRVMFLQINIQRWLGVRLETIGNLLIFVSAILSLNISPAMGGLVISYALNVTGVLNWMVRQIAEVETYMSSVERVSYYINNLETEKALIVEGKRPPESWPTQGEVEFRNLELRYRLELPPVLLDVSFQIKPREKVGIVGRTGAGKSSILQALFRMVEPTSGQILIDGVDISEIGLHDLRRKLAIIPQDPVLFSGSIRSNLDPFGEFSDDQIWSALEDSSLKAFVAGLENKLDSRVQDSGENLSIGQRQLICLARALLKKTRIIVLDEATASIDLATDALIQSTIRTNFTDCTILTIAHRLNTIIDYDRVLVLDRGRVVEFDHPGMLCQRDSVFRSLVNETGESNAANLKAIAIAKLQPKAE